MLRRLGDVKLIRRISNVPFHDDLTAADDDLFGLEDFKHYKESPEMTRKRLQLEDSLQPRQPEQVKSTSSLESAALRKEPMIFISKLTDPYLNLAIEDYVYNKMAPEPQNNRLMFYVNKPCVVIGKNQNPWKEVNLPLLNSLHIPMLRRRSGGGTVVHDSGNVNFSFMTTKSEFSRFKFVNLVVDAINNWGKCKYQLEVSSRGDITTVTQPDGINYKISGSAYKLSRGKSYHHGTMLLNSRLDILGKLLSNSPEKNGIVSDTISIDSVRSKVANIEIQSDEFKALVSEAFKQQYGVKAQLNKEEKLQNSLLGLEDFMEAKEVEIFTIEKNTEINEEILTTAEELKNWNWKFGNTPKFTHQFTNDKYDLKVKFIIGKNAIVEDFELELPSSSSHSEIKASFDFLRYAIDQNELKPAEERLKYKGSDIAGFITHDEISDWIGESIDGTI
ncbi:putative lipoate-protein ligase A [[Candida] jaroonii]|uniref:Lipoate-protein ligase A n=1 Tax=[Candida] jaroonii TaxID=467808 RepID=A0ACA9Y207_9ASCO|nr:putative lipoate-protein ligase A [[Candida] jaroonii]